MQSGYVKLWRKGIDSRVFKNDGLWKVWTWCLMKASYSERWVSMTTGRAEIEIKVLPGQFIYGRNSAAKELDMKPSTVRNRIKKLQNMQNLDVKEDNQYSIVSIVNWDSYQPLDNKEDNQEDNQRTTKGQPKDTNKKVKKVNNYISSKEDMLKPPVSTPFCPHEEIRNLYNQLLPELPTCTIRNSTFDKHTKSRWSEDPQRQSISWWKSFFNTVRESDFLMGRTDKPFTCSLDWLVKPTNFTKVLNGNYKNRGTQKKELSWRI